jgi:BirA family biotin operon repressor/biotin-[acetyl-CoA-carboxylase] ligase
LADLRQLGVTQSRTELTITLIRRLREYLELFERQGFGPFVTAFNDLHAYHGETCALIQGEQSTVGVVQGIGEQGELLLRTNEGVQQFHGGEVSLRPQGR